MLKESQIDEKTAAAIEEMCDRVVNDLKELREGQKITTAKLSALTGIPQPNITRMEVGDTKPNVRTICTIAYALGYNVKFIQKES